MQEDFDLEKSNAGFDKESLLAEIEAERAKLRGERGHFYLFFKTSTYLIACLEAEERVAYDPSVSIFDTLSSEALSTEVRPTQPC